MPTLPKPESRKLRAMNRQTMIALPTWVRRRLGAKPGATLYWHGHRKGEVLLTMQETRSSGPAGRADLEDELRQIAAERDELRESLTSTKLAGARANYAQAYMQALRYLGPLTRQMEALMQKVDRVIEQRHGRPGDAARFRRTRARSHPRAVEVLTLPEAQEGAGGAGAAVEPSGEPSATAPA